MPNRNRYPERPVGARPKGTNVVEYFLKNEMMEYDGWALFRISDVTNLDMAMLK
ncbi:hypothetical protein L915_14571 [Phytophthora nicotianae]|uniref:Uncharacterized protein n=1 Tax=Phytophthora nicotianae TaxID=4792 RepID=W2G9A3_PHYNI|nr:hypothetical protein L915_14571 [Phytophthora nicotianae]